MISILAESLLTPPEIQSPRAKRTSHCFGALIYVDGIVRQRFTSFGGNSPASKKLAQQGRGEPHEVQAVFMAPALVIHTHCDSLPSLTLRKRRLSVDLGRPIPVLRYSTADGCKFSNIALTIIFTNRHLPAAHRLS